MNNNIYKQTMLLCFAFICGNTLMKGYSSQAGTGGWLCVLLGLGFGIFYCLIIHGLLKAYPRLDFFNILKINLGKFLSRALAFLYFLFCVLECAAIVAYMVGFVKSVTVTGRPLIPFIFLLALTCILIAGAGTDTVFRLAQITVPLIILLFCSCLVFLFFGADYQSVMPLFENGASEFLKASSYFALAPFSSLILLYPCLKHCPEIKRRTLIIPTAAAGLLLSAFYGLNALVLGAKIIERMNYPAYMALSVLNFSSFFQRIEIFLFTAFLLCDCLRIALSLRFSSKALCFALNKKGRGLLPFIFALVTVLALTYFKNTDSILYASARDIAFSAFFFFFIPFFIWLKQKFSALQTKRKYGKM